jgi:CHAT domain-containing protein
MWPTMGSDEYVANYTRAPSGLWSEAFDHFDFAAGIQITLSVLRTIPEGDRGALPARRALVYGHFSSVDFEAALRDAIELRKLAVSVGDRLAEWNALHEMGRIYIRLNRAPEAFGALEVAFKSSDLDAASFRRFSLTLADAYLSVGDHPRAEYALARAESTMGEYSERDIRDPRFFGWNLELRLRLARVAEARRQFFDAADKLFGVLELAAAVCREGATGENSDQRSRTVQLWREVETTVHYDLGRYLEHLGRYPKALLHLNMANELARRREDHTAEFLTEERLGSVVRATGEASKALDHLNRALGILENGLPKLRVEEYRNAVREASQSVFDQAVAASLDVNDPERAWEYSERSRARIFLAKMGSGRVSSALTGGDHLADEYTRVSDELATTQDRLFRVPPGVNRDRLKNDETMLRRRTLELVQEIGRRTPMDGSVVELPWQRARDVSERLDERTLIVEFYVTPDSVVRLLAGRGQLFGSQYVIRRETLKAKVLRHRQLLATLPRVEQDHELNEEFTRSASELYRILLQPFERVLQQASRLCLVPHGVLHLLPFSSLRGTQWLIENTALVRAPSATVMSLLLDRTPAVWPSRLVAFANPQPKSAPLKEAELEVAQIARLFPSAKTYKGLEATKTAFIREAPNCDVVHLACHAMFDESSPILSHLQLASDHDPQRHSPLDVIEVARLRLQAGLVVLSACQTGLSELTGGEELLGLVQAFMTAGASSVLASLWSVADRATSVLMRSFYSYLLKVGDKARALNLAQREMLASEEHSSPFFWAGFDLHGDWRVASNRV